MEIFTILNIFTSTSNKGNSNEYLGNRFLMMKNDSSGTSYALILFIEFREMLLLFISMSYYPC